jgi:hypothetical protein
MTLPNDVPPTTVGLAPVSANEVNALIGTHLRAFTTNKLTINQDREWLGSADLKAPPYYFTVEQETLIKSAVADLDTALDAVDMTFINRITGMF